MKKKITSVLLALVMLFSLIPAGAITAWADPPSWYTSGNGTEETPYIISTYDGLYDFAEAVNGESEDTSDKFYKLSDDFGKGSGTAEALTTPIGNDDQPFRGTFDGNGQTVVLNITVGDDECYVAMFASVNNGTVKNVSTTGVVTGAGAASLVGGVVGDNNGGTVTNCYATGNVTGGEESCVGGVVGYSSTSGTVTNCYATGNVTVSGDDAYVGGVVGTSRGTVTNCYATGNVTGVDGSYVGGVVGDNDGGTVTNCYATGDVAGEDDSNVGGVVGDNDSGTVTNCYATGVVTGGESNVGGVVGNNDGGSVTNCYATGDVTGGVCSYAGGVVGYSSTSGTVTNCYATGDVAGESDSDIGGVVGRSCGSVTNCYATGNVTGEDCFYVGGVVGYNFTNGTVTNCYATGDVTGSGGSDVGGVVGNSSGTTVTNCYCLNLYNSELGTALTDANMKAAETSTDSLVYKLNSYLTTTSTPGAKPWKVDSEVNGGYPTFMDVSYQSYVEGTGFETATCTDYTVVTKDTTTFADGGWYVVNSNVTFDSDTNITVSGTANLILCDGYTLTVINPENQKVAVNVASGNTLNIYGQSKGTGTLVATGGECGAGIGGSASGDGGTVTINGGTVIATGEFGAGIGGGDGDGGGGAGGTVTINGGTVTATSSDGAGIGKGCDGSSAGTLTVASGLTIKAGADAGSAVEKTYTPGQDCTEVINGAHYVKIYASWYTSGNGTAATPYIISTYDGLTAFAEAVNDESEATSDKFYKLSDNFGKGSGTAEALTTPIGNDNQPFKGTFDGNGQTVVLNITVSDDEYYVGMFGSVDNGTVKNVSTTGDVTGGEESCVGGVVGYSTCGGSVTNCYATGDVTGGVCSYAGGVVGYSTSGSTVINCYATGNVIGGEGSYVGGVVGSNEGGSVTNCYATGVVTGGNGSYVGGVVGYNNYGGSVTNCYATGNVSNGSYVGGVVGNSSTNGSVTNCYATGNVSNGSYVGGVVGNSSGTTVTNCYCLNLYNSELGTALTDANMKAAETSTDSLVYKLNSYLTTTSTPGAKPWKVDSEVNGGYPIFMDVSYQSYVEGTGFETATCTDYTVVTENTTTFENGKWYVVNSNVTIDGVKYITVSGTAHLILCDGKTLTVTSPGVDKAAIFVASDKTLNIYGQTAGTGTLTATGGQCGAGIGGSYGESGGTVTINGGTVTATGGEYGAGIGGGMEADGGTVTINGGTVTATGGEYGAGIGGGGCDEGDGNGGTVTINGGDVTAIGKSGGAGIGKGNDGGSNGSLTVAAGLTIKAGADAAGAVEKTAAQALGLAYVNITKPEPVAFVDLNGDGSFDEASETKYATVQDAIDAAVAAEGVTNLETAKTVKLISNAKENITIDSGKYVILDLNGFVLKGKGGDSVITNNGTLTVKDSKAADETTKRYWTVGTDGLWTLAADQTTTTNYVTIGGCITGGTGKGDGPVGGGVYSNNSLTLTGGNVVGCSAASGGGIYAEKNLTLSGTAAVIGCKATDIGGGIAYKNGTAFSMTGGEVRNCTSQKAGGIFIENDGVFEMSGGSVMNNTSTSRSGGIEVKGKMTVGGSAKITGNTWNQAASNLCVNKGTVTVSSENQWTTTNQIGVTVWENSSSVVGAFTSNGTADDAKYFTSDDPTYKVKFVDKVTEPSEVPAHLELVNYTVTKLTDITTGITLEKSNMTADQAIAIAKAEFTDPAKQTKVFYKTVGTDPVQYGYVYFNKTWKAASSLYAFDELIKTVGNYPTLDFYVIGTITEKTKVTLDATVANVVAYTGSAVTAPTVTAKEGDSTVTLTKALSFTYYDTTAPTVALEGAPTAVGSYKLVIQVAADEPNYYSDPLVKTFSINKVTNSITGLTIADWTAGETASQPSITSTLFGDNQVTYEYKVKGAEDSTYSEIVPTKAGEYTLRATSTSDGTNYDAGTATVDFTVKEQSVGQAILNAVTNVVNNYIAPAVKNVVKTVSNFFRNIFR